MFRLKSGGLRGFCGDWGVHVAAQLYPKYGGLKA